MTENPAFIPVSAPMLTGNEREYVLDCVDTSWISSAGRYVQRFEQGFAEYIGTRHALACSSGTAALHLALLGLGISAGDEVIVPAMTFVATANAVTYCGGTPIFAESDPRTWNLDPEHVASLVSTRTKAIIAVHLFGLPAEMDALQEIADRHGLPIVEDAAEAHGARFREHRAGSMGRVAIFSFYGNKIMTTGEGGMVTTDDEELAARIHLLRGQGLDPDRRYWHTVVGYNYRMTNIAAALGLAQLEQIEWHLSQRKAIAARYMDLLGQDSRVRFQEAGRDDVEHAYWMTSVVLENADAARRDRVMDYMLERRIELRPFFVPMHRLPIHERPDPEPLPIAENLGDAGISLPSGAGLSGDDQERVVRTLRLALDETG